MIKSSLYDSIDLASTLSGKSIQTLNKDGNEQPMQSNETVTKLEDIDEDADDYNPEEFISSNEGIVKSKLTSSSQNAIEKLISGSFDNEFLEADSITSFEGQLPPSDVLNMLASLEWTRANTDLIEHLSRKIAFLKNNIRKTVSLHGEYLSSGRGDVPLLRESARKYLLEVSQCFLSLNEIYEKQHSDVINSESTFKCWSMAREKLLNKINRTLSDKTKQGAKLASLVNESNKIDNEIEDLESRIARLKEKKAIISKEIDYTLSVIQSRTSVLVDQLQDIEGKGKRALFDYLASMGYTKEGIIHLMNTKVVPIEFGLQKFRKTDVKSTMSQESTSQGNMLVPHYPNNLEDANKRETGSDLDPATKQNRAQSSHYDIASKDAYERGYAKGVNSSSAIKTQLQKLISHKNTTPSTLPASMQTSIHVEDGMIIEQTDLNRVLEFLHRQAQALDSQILESSRAAAAFHENALAWEELLRHIVRLEEDLEKLIALPYENETSKTYTTSLTRKIQGSLKRTLETLTTRQRDLANPDILPLHLQQQQQQQQQQRQLHDSRFAKMVVNDLLENEVQAVRKALQLIHKNVGNNNDAKDAKDAKNINNNFEA